MPWYHRNTDGTFTALAAGRALSRDHVRPQMIFDPGSWWYKRLPTNPPLDANSSAIMANKTGVATVATTGRYADLIGAPPVTNVLSTSSTT